MNALMRRRISMLADTGGGGGDQPIGVNLIVWSGQMDSGREFSEYIPIVGGASYIVNILTTDFTDTRNIMFYDAQKSYIENSSWKPSVSAKSNIAVNPQIPSGAAYMRAYTYPTKTDTMEIIRIS